MMKMLREPKKSLLTLTKVLVKDGFLSHTPAVLNQQLGSSVQNSHFYQVLPGDSYSLKLSNTLVRGI